MNILLLVLAALFLAVPKYGYIIFIVAFFIGGLKAIFFPTVLSEDVEVVVRKRKQATANWDHTE